MVMTWFWTVCVLASVGFALAAGRGGDATAALLDGAQKGVTLCVSMAGPLCLWAGLGTVMDRAGLTGILAKALRPILGRLFPSSQRDPELAGHLSGNVTANLLGLGNAATPMGIRAAGELCRLVVMNTASIQLLPTTVAVVRRSAGCASPFDLLPCVWVSSILSVSAGLSAAWLFGRIWRG